MSDVDREAAFFGEYNFNSYLWPLSYCEDRNFYFLEAPGKDKLGYIGFSFIGNPMAGFDEKTINKLQSIFAAPFPDGSFLHMMLFKSPDMQPYIERMLDLRRKEKDVLPILQDMVSSRGDFLQSMTVKSISRAAKTYVHNSLFQFDVKIPVKHKYGPPVEEDIEKCNELMVGMRQVLETCGMRVENLDPERLIRFYGTLLNWGEHASW